MSVRSSGFQKWREYHLHISLGFKELDLMQTNQQLYLFTYEKMNWFQRFNYFIMYSLRCVLCEKQTLANRKLRLMFWWNPFFLFFSFFFLNRVLCSLHFLWAKKLLVAPKVPTYEKKQGKCTSKLCNELIDYSY